MWRVQSEGSLYEASVCEGQSVGGSTCEGQSARVQPVRVSLKGVPSARIHSTRVRL